MISIAMTTYNGEPFLSEQIHSILSQTYSDWELIICDDRSTDGTYKILSKLERIDSRIHVFQNVHNLGFLKNFEKALSLCKGDYIACCDQDDIWTKDHLKTLLDKIQNNDCIGANALIVDSEGKSIKITTKDILTIEQESITNQDIFKHECFYNLIQGTACLLRKELISEILPFPQGIKFHDHWIALCASLRKGCSYNDNIILNYRNHGKNITGYKSFHIVQAIKTALNSRKIRSTMYTSNIAMLKAIQSKTLNQEQQNYIQEALLFFENLSSNKKRIPSVIFYIKHYNEITLSFKKNWIKFSYRVFCLAFFGTML